MLKALLLTFGTALLPVLEIRGAIPVGIANGLDAWTAYIVGVVGNMLPIPFLILLARHIIAWLQKHNILVKFTSWLQRKGEEKSEVVQRYSFWGLLILVAIPLPGTGAWTGSLIAALLGMRFRKAFSAVLVGIAIATVIMSALSYGLLGVIFG